MITLNVTLHSNPRGPRFWKLNTSLLSDTEYIDLIKQTIAQTQEEYKNDESINPALLWDMIKLKVRDKSLSFAAAKKRKTTLKEQRELESSSTSAIQRLSLAEQLESCKSELEQIIRWRTQGAILRCKAKWYNEGEKNTKYFLNLEKRYCKLSTITQLKINEHDPVTSDSDILAECEAFYTELYTSRGTTIPPVSEFFQLENNTVLNHDGSTSGEGQLTEKECLEALKSMDSDKTPGTDGLPAEFYKTFWTVWLLF